MIRAVNNDISVAETLHSDFYTKEEYFRKSIELIFEKSWQYIGDRTYLLSIPENVYPTTILENTINERVLLIKENDRIVCMSNICTHRGFQIVHHPSKMSKVVCGYHGRRFDLNGKMEYMPEFKGVKYFPRTCDHLHHLPLQRWKRFLFSGIDPKIDFHTIADKLDERLGFLDMDNWRYAPEYKKTYNIKANWALYCDNYLEGFHIPFVHQDLNAIIDYGEYTTECYDHMSVQIGYGKNGDRGFDLPKNHPDFGKVVTAYYYWLFPNFMLNVYTWGVQINTVIPISKDYCKVVFDYFISDEEEWERFGKDALAEKVEREDEYVVESVQKGMYSKFYTTGRYSVKREKGVHHFHRLVSEYLNLE